MTLNILILGASYGSLFGTKVDMSGHNATLVCRGSTADLINAQGTEVRLRLKGEDAHRTIRSVDLPGAIDAAVPEAVDPAHYDLCVLAMQEPQYSAHAIWTLLAKIAEAKIPCLSLMNMPPLSYLKRLPGLDTEALEGCFSNPRIWDRFDPDLMSLCSPDPQAFRPPEEAANILHVGLPTNFKAAKFASDHDNAVLHQIANDIDAVRLDGKDVPVKLRIYDSLMVPLAKWSMLMAGNFRCINYGGVRSIRDAVHEDLSISRSVYDFVGQVARKLGAEPSDQVPFEKYAAAAEGLLKPSSAARALHGGSVAIERVDRLIQATAAQLGMNHPVVDATVGVIDAVIEQNYYTHGIQVAQKAA